MNQVLSKGKTAIHKLGIIEAKINTKNIQKSFLSIKTKNYFFLLVTLTLTSV